MKTKQLRKYTTEELQDRLKAERKKLNDLYFDIRSGQEKDYSQISKNRKNIARILSVLQEKSKTEDNKVKVSMIKSVKKNDKESENKKDKIIKSKQDGKGKDKKKKEK